MTGLFQYTIGDFLLFSEDTYLELLRYFHVAIWPLQIAALALAGYSLVSLYRGGPKAIRVVIVGFSASWFLIGFVFLGSYYADINWLANAFVVLFCIQGTLLFWLLFLPIRKRNTKFSTISELYVLDRNKYGKSLFARNSYLVRFVGPGVLVSATLVLPLLLKAQERDWDQLEVIFITPDATSLATIGLLFCFKNILSNLKFCLLTFIPMLWCLFTLLTMWSIQSAAG